MELNAPFGTRPPPKPKRRIGAIFVLAGAGVAIGAVGIFLATADPKGGEPYAVAPIPPPAGQLDPTASNPDITPTGSLSQTSDDRAPGSADQGSPNAGAPKAPPMSVGSLEGGIKVFRGSPDNGNGGGTVRTAPRPSAGPLVIDVTKALDDPDRKRALPAGTAPVVTGPTPAAGTARVAIFISGMGLSAAATRTAIETMPAAVDLAYVPYGETVQASADSAKAKGHEILLQVPMQTSQGTNPGPHALRPDEAAPELAADLDWLMGRLHGYAGVANLLGAPVTANASTMNTLLKTVASRGTFYVDDGTSKRSLAPSLASTTGASVMQADVVIDATGDPNIVRANLEQLASLARQNGHAIGMASGLPDHMGAIAKFAADLGGQGILLVPVSVLAGRDASVATAR